MIKTSYNFNTARAVKKLLFAGVEVTATLQNYDTQNVGLIYVNTKCFHSRQASELLLNNKTAAYHIKPFEYNF